MEYNNIYRELGLKAVINASGRMTRLGVSVIDDEVGKVLVEAAKNYVVIDELLEWSGKRIGELIGCPDACVTSSTSAGIALSIASLICGNDLYKTQNFYDTLAQTSKREVILLCGHNINYSVPLSLMMELGGAKVVEVGYANRSTIQDVIGAINERTLAIMMVHSHYCVQHNMVSIPEVIALGNQRNIPVIVDAGADEDLGAFTSYGADFVCFSGNKAICGPTSGLVACKDVEKAENMRLQYKGIGRAMKIGKENILGLVKAIELYKTRVKEPIITVYDLEDFMEKVNRIKGLSCLLTQDEAGRKIYRAKILFDERQYGMSAQEASDIMMIQNPAIYTRDPEAHAGVLAIDPRPLNSKAELDEIYHRLQMLQR